MGKRRPWLVLAVLLFPFEVHADDHKADLCFASPSYMSGSTTWGLHVSASLMAKEKKGTPTLEEAFDPVNWSAVTELSAYSGRDGTDPTRFAFLIGPRYAFSPSKQTADKRSRLNLFVQALIGSIHTRDSAGRTLSLAGNVTSPIVGGGVGFDFLFSTDKHRTWGIRGQFDLLTREPFKGSQREWIKRASAGAIYRFPTHE